MVIQICLPAHVLNLEGMLPVIVTVMTEMPLPARAKALSSQVTGVMVVMTTIVMDLKHSSTTLVPVAAWFQYGLVQAVQ